MFLENISKVNINIPLLKQTIQFCGSLTLFENGLSLVQYDISKSKSLSIFDDIQNNMQRMAMASQVSV